MIIATPSNSSSEGPFRTHLGELSEKETVTILVTDSGLGGLSVCAAIERRIRTEKMFRTARIVFANALPESGQGYNRMSTTAQKVLVFEAALNGMVRWCVPDVILVACNTLSVLLPEIRFTRESPVPILGIVETGVAMLFEHLQSAPDATGIIFGTETTIGMNTHKRLLVEMGIDPSRILTQPCPDLAAMIEETGGDEAVRSAIDGFVAAALPQPPGRPGQVYAGLCCTHYGYCRGLFEESLRRQGVRNPVVLDPNARMEEILFAMLPKRRYDRPEILVEVVSRALISPEEVASIARLVEPVSPATAAALRSYLRKRDLFPYAPAAS